MTDDYMSADPGARDDDPTSSSNGATAERVHRTLAAAALTDTHVAAGLDDLRRRLGGATVVPLAPAGSRATSRRPLALAAAAVLLLVVAAVIVVGVAKWDKAPDKVGGIEGSATGWYVPSPLPAGWEVDSITSDLQNVTGFGGTCPCRLTTWANAAKGQVLVEGSTTAVGGRSGALIDNGRSVAIGEGIEAMVGQAGVDLVAIQWKQDDTSVLLIGRNLSEGQLTAAARTRLRSPDDSASPLDGLAQVDQAVAPDGVGSYHLVSVNLRNSGLKVVASYTMVSAGFGGELTFVPTRASVPGQRLPLLSLRPPVDAGDAEASIYFGRWPGADVTITTDCVYCGQSSSTNAVDSVDPGGAPTPEENPDVVVMAGRQATDAQVRAIIASLRPADAATWKAFIRAHPTDPDPDLAVESIDDLNTPGHAATGD